MITIAFFLFPKSFEFSMFFIFCSNEPELPVLPEPEPEDFSPADLSNFPCFSLFNKSIFCSGDPC